MMWWKKWLGSSMAFILLATLVIPVIDGSTASAADWKTEANDRIEQIRKRNAEIRVVDASGNPISGATVSVKQTKHRFGFGSAINTNVLTNATYANFFKNHFEWAVHENESKWYSTETSQGNVNYSNADKIMEWTEANGIISRGHTVLWEVEANNPSWVKSLTGTALRSAMDSRITSVVNHFKGKYVHWDVNNEMLHGSFFKDRLGAAIWPYMYQRVRALDPNVKLFVNDYNVIEYDEDVAYKAQIKSLLDQGAPIDGIGAQGHFGATIDPVAVKRRLDNLATFGLPIWITEYDSTVSNENTRADNLEAMYRLAFSHSSVDGVLMWGFWAGSHWRGADAAIVNQDWTLNAAGKRYEALLKEWTTVQSGTTTSDGKYPFRGFHGTYEITVTAPGAAAVTKTFELEPGSTTQVFTVQTTGNGGGNPNPTVPAAPTGVTATVGDAQASLNWNAVSGATSYTVKRATTSGGPYTTVATGIAATSYVNTGLTNGTPYYYVVSAVNSVGESTNSSQVSVTPTVSQPPSTSNLAVQYKLNNTSIIGNTINATFNIKNNGTAAVNLSNLKLRYYLTKEGSASLNFWCDWAQVGTSSVNGSFGSISPAKTGADTYLEIGFSSAAGSIAAGGQSGDIQIRIAKADWTNFDQANDYSFDSTKTSYANWNKVTLFQNGNLAWGIEP